MEEKYLVLSDNENSTAIEFDKPEGHFSEFTVKECKSLQDAKNFISKICMEDYDTDAEIYPGRINLFKVENIPFTAEYISEVVVKEIGNNS